MFVSRYPIVLVYRRNFGDCFIGYGFLMELSTPFVSLRAILAHCGQKRSKFYVLNGILMMTVFFCCRILIFPIIYQLYGDQAGKHWESGTPKIQTSPMTHFLSL